LAAAVLGDKFFWWIDPIGAILLAIYTISNWSGTVWENAGLCTFSTETLGLANSTCTHQKSAILLILCCNRKDVLHGQIFVMLLTIVVLCTAVSLVGESAPPEMLQKLTYLAIRHHPEIKRVDTVRAYTFGVLYFVEVHISSFYS
jgi:divalent metal cation (Fe/Co/Zn/Cd) transporter